MQETLTPEKAEEVLSLAANAMRSAAEAMGAGPAEVAVIFAAFAFRVIESDAGRDGALAAVSCQLAAMTPNRKELAKVVTMSLEAARKIETLRRARQENEKPFKA